jgi:putative ABC transport system permease protein
VQTLRSNFSIAWRNLMANKTRSILTLLGMVIGVAAVISIVSLGEGMKKMFAGEINKAGKDVIQIIPKAMMREGIVNAAGRADLFNMGDVEALERNAPLITDVQAGMQTTGLLKRGAKSFNAILEGGDAGFLESARFNLQSGVGITEKDVRGRTRAAVIGDKVKKELFSEFENPLGQTIKVSDQEFTVVGVMEHKGGMIGGPGQDDMVVVPLTTMQSRIIGSDDVFFISARFKDISKADEAKDEIRRILRQRRHITDATKESFEIQTPEDWMKLGSDFMNVLIIIFSVIAAFSLLIGGIGIMNVMMVTVAERTSEIGLRMALGAQPRIVFGQFLIEAMLLTYCGTFIGLIFGFILGLGLAKLLSFLTKFPWPINVPFYIILLAFAAGTLFGVVFGSIPAYLASSKDPVEALRYE